jgi:hypothetical protein
MLNFLHSAINEDVADMVLAKDQTAHQLWLAALKLFSANKPTEAIYLDNDFLQLIQGELSVTEYYRRQKRISDGFADNDSPVSDRALVLNTLRGLGPRYASIISMTEPLSSFLCVRNMLFMEEMQQANTASNTALTTLVAIPIPHHRLAMALLAPVTPRLYRFALLSSIASTWDTSYLIVVMNNLALHQGAWVMESGASSHMKNNDGKISLPTELSHPHIVTVGSGPMPFPSPPMATPHLGHLQDTRLNSIICFVFRTESVIFSLFASLLVNVCVPLSLTPLVSL